ncbi:MAG: CHAD domain-containing protein [Pseudomonadota bacterium]
MLRLSGFVCATIALSLIFAGRPVVAFGQETLRNGKLDKEHFERTQETINSGDHPGKVASILILGALHQIDQDIKEQKSDVLPHELKDFRKDLGDAKIITDIFIFSFPKTGDQDVLLKFREDLDEGYLVAGEFKDLFDKQGITLAVKDPKTGKWSKGTKPEDIDYPKDKLKEKRQAYLKWAEKFEKKDKQETLVKYFSEPLLNGMEMREQKDISRMYWGGLAKLPSSESTLAQYLSLLIAQLTDVLAEDYTKVLDIDDILHDEVAFHDVRKRMRSLVKIHEFFQRQIDPNQELSAPIKEFQSIADNFGSIHDMMIGIEDLSKKEKENRSEKIRSLWDKERDRLNRLDILKALKEVKDHLEKL